MGLQFAGFWGEQPGACSLLPGTGQRQGLRIPQLLSLPGERSSCLRHFRDQQGLGGDFRNPGSEFAIIANRWSSTWWKKDLGANVLGEDRGKWKFTES